VNLVMASKDDLATRAESKGVAGLLTVRNLDRI
jgi:hypothetical protein